MTAQRDDSAVREQLAAVLAGGDPVTRQERLDAEAVLAENVVIKRADLPEVVEERGGDFRVDGVVYANSSVSAARALRAALRYLALAEHLEAKEAREAEAAKEAELTARRDVLANELIEKVYGEDQRPRGYASRTRMMRAAIDRIIEAEDKLAEYEAQENAAAGGAPSEPSP